MQFLDFIILKVELYWDVFPQWLISSRGPIMRFTRITHNPTVMGGKPCIRGLRVTGGTVVGLLAAGETKARILQAYPYLEPADLDECLAYAAWRLEEREEDLVAS